MLGIYFLMPNKVKKTLAVIPTDPISAYVKQGLTPKWLESYYNPNKFFDKVYLLSPLEKDQKNLCGMTVVHTNESTFRNDLKRLNVDIVRAYGGNWTADLACLNKVKGIPVVVSIHDKRASYTSNSIKNANFIFCTSEIVKKVTLKKLAKLDKIWILPNRVDLKIMKPADRDIVNKFRQKYSSKYVILHVGRKSEEKNLATVIRTLPVLGKDYSLITIGSGDERPYFNLAKKINVYDQFFSIQHIDNHILPQYYSFCDCMCTPSLCEGFGIVFIEAIACEAVVVTSDIAPMNEYIKAGFNGLLVKKYTDPKSLAEKIKLACTDNSLRKTIKTNARKSVVRFSKAKIDALEVEYYSKILHSSKTNISFLKRLGKLFSFNHEKN